VKCTTGAVDSSLKLRERCWIGRCHNHLYFSSFLAGPAATAGFVELVLCIIVPRRIRVWDSGIGHTVTILTLYTYNYSIFYSNYV
jgi:hypothetical protein